MIVTGRARMILLFALVVSILSVLEHRWLSANVGAAILLWVGFEWIAFRWCADVALEDAVVTRVVSDRSGPVRTLWEGRTYTVDTRIDINVGPGRFYLKTADLTPATAQLDSADAAVARTAVERALSLTLSYQVRARDIGAMTFAGMRVRIADLSGLFYAERFIVARSEFVVLPAVARLGMRTPSLKRANQLPPPGIHRHSRPGIGSDLLELREYVPGDSPRSIAWKVSARRDELLSKQYESEVPIRCTMFIDISNGARLGQPGRTMLGSFARIAAAVFDTAMASRDPVGMTLFDAKELNVTAPTTNRRYALRFVNELGRACGRPVEPVSIQPDYLISSALTLARTVCPRAIRELRLSFRIFPLRPAARRRQLERYQLASILAAHFGLGSTAVGRMMGDDSMFSSWMQRFLSEFQIATPDVMLNDDARVLFAEPQKIERLSLALRHAIAKSRDNELFVIMADLVGFLDHLEPLLKAVRAAAARHHRVVIACGWPVGFEPPRPDESLNSNPKSEPTVELVRHAERRMRVRAFHALKHRFGKILVPVVCAEDELTPRMVLAQFEMIRLGASRR